MELSSAKRNSFSKRDQYFMDHALMLARRALGTTAPNPSVGCMIVKDGIIIGEGTTQKGGRPHAETVALAQAGTKAQDATLYVTLEPCCHRGKTPPCTESIINAGIKKVIIATQDPFARVNGKGIEQLKAANIEIIYGVQEQEACILNQGFFSVQTKGRPWITAKVAMSLDGKIATSTGHSKWITNEQSRHYAHQLRATHDAILVGSGTVLADDPLLTCRLPDVHHTPIRIILDRQLCTPLTSQLIKTSHDVPCWIYSTQNKSLGNAILLPYGDSLHDIVNDMATRGITRLLIEGGSKILSAFLEAKLIDELICIRAPIIIGNDGLPAFQAFGHTTISQGFNLTLTSNFALGSDVVELYSLA